MADVVCSSFDFTSICLCPSLCLAFRARTNTTPTPLFFFLLFFLLLFFLSSLPPPPFPLLPDLPPPTSYVVPPPPPTPGSHQPYLHALAPLNVLDVSVWRRVPHGLSALTDESQAVVVLLSDPSPRSAAFSLPPLSSSSSLSSFCPNVIFAANGTSGVNNYLPTSLAAGFSVPGFSYCRGVEGSSVSFQMSDPGCVERSVLLKFDWNVARVVCRKCSYCTASHSEA